MSATTISAETASSNDSGPRTGAATPILVCLGPAYEAATPDQLAPVFDRLSQALAGLGQPVTVAFPSGDDGPVTEDGGLYLQPYRPVESSRTVSVQTAGAYLSAFELLRSHQSLCCVLVGGEAETLDADALRLMVDAVLNGRADLALPRYALGPEQGLLNSAVLAPLSRAMYGLKTRYPLALDLAMSPRMAEHMATAAQRFTSSAQSDAVLWPVAEAATSGYAVAEISCGSRALPASNMDLGTILNTVAGSLFSDIEARASFWQRTRPAVSLITARTALADQVQPTHDPVDDTELQQMMQTYRLGYRDLHEIWSLVLPPNTLLGLKRLSAAPPENFVFADALWTRVVYDFVLAHRLRTLNRGHLLGAFAPLYLAWVASHLHGARNGTTAEQHTEQVAKSFEADKPYLVSRWRWPDRFNP